MLAFLLGAKSRRRASGEGGLASTLVPILVAGTLEAPILIGHIAKANPQWKTADPASPALAICIGANGYVSPSLYPSKLVDGKVVPTWNFVQVQAEGLVEFTHETDDLLSIVSDLTRRHEAGSNQPWSVDDAPSDFLSSKLAGIVGFKMVITSLEGSFKLSQNQSEENFAGVVAAMPWVGDSVPLPS